MKFSKLFFTTFLLFGLTYAQDDNGNDNGNENEVENNEEIENYFGENKECWSEKLNYPCCPKDNCKVVYINDDGSWGLHKFRWCGIDRAYCLRKENECWSKPLGYKCCPKEVCEAAHVDDTGAWGIYNDEWCGIISPVCT